MGKFYFPPVPLSKNIDWKEIILRYSPEQTQSTEIK